jgi:hypothetical protein
MSKKRVDKSTNPQQGQAKDHHRQPVLGVRISGRLVDQVRTLAKRNRRPLTTEITIALEEYLEKNGLWPPPDEAD